MTKITNTASGARGVRTVNGVVMVEPGQTVDVDLAENEGDLYEGLEKGGRKAAESDEPKPLAKMNKTELLQAAADAGITAAADDEGKDVALGDATNKQLIAAIEAKNAKPDEGDKA